MIIDLLVNTEKYFKLHPNLEQGFKYLLETDLVSLQPGKYEINGSDVFALVQEYETIPQGNGKWESHYKYTDIQYMVSGSEKMGYSNIRQMRLVEEYPEKDLIFHNGEGELFTINEGSFAVFTTEDAHMPTILADEPRMVKKVVVKVAMG